MPSFSLVRRFGKQRKATLDSPVSSAPVGQHIGHPIPESSNHQTSQDFPVVNAGSGRTVNNSHGLLSGTVALSQHVEGVSIKNITGPVMSNNRFAVLRVGDIHLEEEVWSSYYRFIFKTRYKGKIASSTSVLSIWSYCGMRPAESYGICRSPHLTALVFHGASSLMHWLDYCKTLPSSQWMTHYLKFAAQSAHNMLKAHNLHGWMLYGSVVDETGKLVIAHFFPGPLDDFDLGTHIWMAFETNTFIKEDLLDYYNFLLMMMDPGDCHASTPGGNNLVLEVNGMDTTVEETGIVVTLLPNMTIRPSIATWASQANHLIHNLPINIMDLQTESFEHWHRSKDNIYWSRDEEGRHVIEDSLIREAFGITVNCYWHYSYTDVFRMPPQCYEILRTIHEGCGFDPYSTQIAEYLHLPLLVADGGHSGLEEYFNADVEDAEYTSESESGDSDYVSATEDA
ncbi:hypothetical protein C8J56DRAFT_1082184 [Mycena floridula]|nr:hypothetical protein C8J56DRAFT_1082184 [Mycena floridula]